MKLNNKYFLGSLLTLILGINIVHADTDTACVTRLDDGNATPIWIKWRSSDNQVINKSFVTIIGHNVNNNTIKDFQIHHKLDSKASNITWKSISNTHNPHPPIYGSGSLKITSYASIYQKNPPSSGTMLLNDTLGGSVRLINNGNIVCFKNAVSYTYDVIHNLHMIDRQVHYYLGNYSEEDVDKDLELYKKTEDEEQRCGRKCCKRDGCSVS
jgi:hypothetical protein